MSKIKSNRLEPRAGNGSLTIGNPASYTTFEGDVHIPGYATEKWVEGIVTEDIAIELSTYQKRDEKNKPLGYAGLDENGMVPDAHIPDADDKYVQRSGDTMSGNLGMGGKKVTDCADPTLPADVATKAYVDGSAPPTPPLDDYLPLAGGTMTGTIALSGTRDIDCAFGGNAKLTYNGHDAFEWGNSVNIMHQALRLDSDLRNIDVAQGTAGHLQYDGADKIRWGTKVYMDGEIDNMGNQIRNVAGPTEDNDAANKYYVDNASKYITGPVRIDADYSTSDEVVFGVYVNLTRDQAVERGFDPETDAEGGPHPMDPEVRVGYGLFRVMGDGKLWGFNSLKGLSAVPGANQDATNKEYVDGKLAVARAELEAKIRALDLKIAAIK